MKVTSFKSTCTRVIQLLIIFFPGQSASKLLSRLWLALYSTVAQISARPNQTALFACAVHIGMTSHNLFNR